MMKNLLPILLVIIFTACKSTKNSINYAEQGFVKATVIKYEVETCGYILQLENESKLMPDKLEDSFKKHELKVWIKYELLKKQPMTTCMAGKAVKMLEIKKQ